MRRLLAAAVCALALASCASTASAPPVRPVTSPSAATSTPVGTTTTTLAPHAQALADIRLYVPALDRTPDEHLVALINGGANAEGNLSVTCGWCLPEKNAADVAEKSLTYRKRSKHLGIKAKHSLIPGSRGTPFRKHMDGTVSRRTP